MNHSKTLRYSFNEAKGNPGPEWLLKVQKLKDETADVEMGLGFAIMFLEDLGKAYASGNSQEIKTYKKSIESELGGGTPQEAKVENPIGHPLAINVLAYKEDERNGRNRLNITIIPADDSGRSCGYCRSGGCASTKRIESSYRHRDHELPEGR